MKNILIIISLFALGFQACNKDEAGTAGIIINNVIPPYVELTSTAAKTVKQGASTSVTFRMRTALQEAVTVTYSVTGGGVNLTNQTVVIPRNSLTAAATINIPAGVIVAPATAATATLTLVKAVTASNRTLTIGQKNDPATQVVTVNITL